MELDHESKYPRWGKKVHVVLDASSPPIHLCGCAFSDRLNDGMKISEKTNEG
jgi:hypothetical protein